MFFQASESDKAKAKSDSLSAKRAAAEAKIKATLEKGVAKDDSLSDPSIDPNPTISYVGQLKKYCKSRIFVTKQESNTLSIYVGQFIMLY